MLAAHSLLATPMTLAIFDLDNTLIGGDSDNLWGKFVCDRGLVDAEEFGARNDQFYRDYQAGTLDIDAYLRFALSPLIGQAPEVIDAWHRDFMTTVIEPILLPAADELIDRHRRAGHHPLIITATNAFITRPIATRLGIEDLIACEGEIINGRYTGEPLGIPSYAFGKVTRLQAWLEHSGESMEGAWFYSDSHNDLPLLERVANPVAVDPDDRLRAHAETAGWEIITLRA